MKKRFLDALNKQNVYISKKYENSSEFPKKEKEMDPQNAAVLITLIQHSSTLAIMIACYCIGRRVGIKRGKKECYLEKEIEKLQKENSKFQGDPHE